MAKKKKVLIAYIVSTDLGEFMYDQDLKQVTDDGPFEPVAVITFQQETLAPAEDWEEWGLNYDEPMIVEQIRRLIISRIKKLALDLEKL